MEKNNIVEFRETVELFVHDTIPHIKSNTEVPNINFVFSEEAFALFKDVMKHPFETPDAWTPSISQEDIDKLKQMTYFNDELPTIIVHDHNLFFRYLTDITNAFITLHKKYHIDFSARAKLIRILRRIWLRMGPDDFNQVELFLRNQLNFLKDNILDKYKEETTIGSYCGYDIKAQVKLNDTWSETTRCMRVKIYDDANSYHSLPNIYYDILNENNQNICYIYAIQNDRKRKKIKKIERLLYKLNKGVIEQESQEYKDYLNKTSNYYPENISDVHPGEVLSLIYFIKILKQNNITAIRAPILQVLSYDFHTILSNKIKIDFLRTWTPEVIEDMRKYHKEWLEEDYLHDKERYEHIVDKEDLISKNKTETFIRVFKRASFHNPEIEIRNDPLLQGDYLDIRLKKKIKAKQD